MLNLKSIRHLKNLAGKRVLLRVDFNVPMAGEEILDDFKIKANLLTIRFLLRQKCKIIIISHLAGRKSLRPIAVHLNKILQIDNNLDNPLETPVYTPLDLINATNRPKNKNLPQANLKFVPDLLGFQAEEALAKIENGEILILENIGRHKEEWENNKNFAKKLAKIADLYINNAFSISQHSFASIEAIQNYLPSYAGLLLEKELSGLDRLLRPSGFFVLIVGGTNTETKLPLLLKFYEKCDIILLGGGVANTFLKILDFEVGQSVIGKAEAGRVGLVKQKINYAKRRKIISPLDFIVKTKDDKNVLKNVEEIEKSDRIMDIGPKTITLYSGVIKRGKNILWTGPMGRFEEKEYSQGTLAIARTLAAKSSGKAFGAVIGEETLKALDQTKMIDYVDLVPTGQASALVYLLGDKMPGLKKLII